MSEETREVGDQGPQDGNDGKDDHGDRVCKHRMGRRTRLTVLVVTLLGAGILLGAGVTAQAARYGWHGMGHHWGHAKTEEQVRERALDKTAWVLGRVDATPGQQQAINAIVTALVGDLYPLRSASRDQRRALITELARPEVDAEALETIRSEGIGLADQASRSLVTAVVDASRVLTPEQREELAAMVARHRR